MNFEQMLKNRESCRAYADKPVKREDLIKICEAGRLTPSACNSQPWKFMVVDEPEAKALLCDALFVEDRLTGAAWREQCPAFIVIAEQKAKLKPFAIEYYNDTQRFAPGDVGMACLNMCYQALELGLSTCIVGMVDKMKMTKLFGVSEDEEVRMVLAVGYAAEQKPPRPKVRKEFEEVVCFNKWK